MQKPYAIALVAALTLGGTPAIQSALAKDTITPVAGEADMTELTGEVVVINRVFAPIFLASIALTRLS